mmetsp:Transcript_30416/g.76131  ORF Transcript_30416/g.76131 Transcript_30416/m.76131 type:complete len:332 (+) Transcript_30416:2659-3654(+)
MRKLTKFSPQDSIASASVARRWISVSSSARVLPGGGLGPPTPSSSSSPSSSIPSVAAEVDGTVDAWVAEGREGRGWVTATSASPPPLPPSCFFSPSTPLPLPLPPSGASPSSATTSGSGSGGAMSSANWRNCLASSLGPMKFSSRIAFTAARASTMQGSSALGVGIVSTAASSPMPLEAILLPTSSMPCTDVTMSSKMASMTAHTSSSGGSNAASPLRTTSFTSMRGRQCADVTPCMAARASPPSKLVQNPAKDSTELSTTVRTWSAIVSTSCLTKRGSMVRRASSDCFAILSVVDSASSTPSDSRSWQMFTTLTTSSVRSMSAASRRCVR